MGLADREYNKRDRDGRLQCLSKDEDKSITSNKTCYGSLGDKIRCSLQSLSQKIKKRF
ncbi:MAG: hypothetical protein ACLFMM_04270 [Methanohalobium sp.]|uniref:hypothetical protein n=1 Tax=Methanohalobium sp. TaxID=2837493 RepID=UPI003979EB0A